MNRLHDAVEEYLAVRRTDLVHYRITGQLTRNRNAESHDKAVSHCFFSDQQLHRPGPNLNCRLRVRCASSMPERVTAAVR